jgi:dipeptidyl aminopeptidase/acylaminoacyl peptidase
MAQDGAMTTAPGSTPAYDDEVTERWQARFRATRTTLPQWAHAAPDRCLYAGNASGTFELYAWDRTADAHRQVTDRRNGTFAGALDPPGESVWWFADTDGDEFGGWQRQPFSGGADEPAAPSLAPAYPSGLAIGPSVAAVGRSTDEGVQICLLEVGQPAREVYAAQQDAHVVALSRDETLLCIAHSEHGDALKPALRALRVADGSTVADLWDGPGKGLEGVDFSPLPGDPRVLAVHERSGPRRPLLWNPVTGEERLIEPSLPGEVAAEWYADGSALLLRHDHRGRSELYRQPLDGGAPERLDTPTGTVMGATARPGGEVEFLWSSAAEPSQVRAVGRAAPLLSPAVLAPPSVPVEDVDADGPGGQVHGLLARPAGAPPYPAVFLIHGGPMWHDSDAFMADRAAWVDCGYAVVHVNYRGSTGYGAPWQDAINGRPGLTELEDIAAIRDRLMADGVVDPARLVLAGASWGGYLTLLGLGTQPDSWAAGIASVPVADYVAAYEDEMQQLRDTDRSIFGGSPEEVPEVYRRCSPISYVNAVRAPVLVLAGANDPRCPIRQIENYLARLDELGKAHEVYRYDAGHGSLVVEERIRQMGAEIDFVRRHLAVEPASTAGR